MHALLAPQRSNGKGTASTLARARDRGKCRGAEGGTGTSMHWHGPRQVQQGSSKGTGTGIVTR